MSRLPRAFFARAAEVVAPDLLSAFLVLGREDGLRRGRIVETEAYVGAPKLVRTANDLRQRDGWCGNDAAVLP